MENKHTESELFDFCPLTSPVAIFLLVHAIANICMYNVYAEVSQNSELNDK